MSGAASPKLVAVAEVARPHGVRGELRLRLFNESSDLLLRKPRVWLRAADGATREIKLRAARPVAKALLVEINGVGDRDAAEALRGAEVLVRRDDFPEPDEGEFYACDLEGARVVLAGETIGEVARIASYPTCDVLVVTRAGGATLEVPLTDAFVGEVDVADARVELKTIDGL